VDLSLKRWDAVGPTLFVAGSPADAKGRFTRRPEAYNPLIPGASAARGASTRGDSKGFALTAGKLKGAVSEPLQR